MKYTVFVDGVVAGPVTADSSCWSRPNMAHKI